MKKMFLKKEIRQFIKFGFVGLSNTAISYISYYLLIKVNIYYLIAHIISFIISVLNSFILNNRFVFKNNNKSKLLVRILKTYISYGITFLLSTALLTIQVELLNVSKLLAPFINLVITIPLNFILNKYWAFSEERKNKYNEKNN